MINKVKVLKLIIVSNLRKIVVIKSLKMKQYNEEKLNLPLRRTPGVNISMQYLHFIIQYTQCSTKYTPIISLSLIYSRISKEAHPTCQYVSLIKRADVE